MTTAHKDVHVTDDGRYRMTSIPIHGDSSQATSRGRVAISIDRRHGEAVFGVMDQTGEYQTFLFAKRDWEAIMAMLKRAEMVTSPGAYVKREGR